MRRCGEDKKGMIWKETAYRRMRWGVGETQEDQQTDGENVREEKRETAREQPKRQRDGPSKDSRTLGKWEQL